MTKCIYTCICENKITTIICYILKRYRLMLKVTKIDMNNDYRYITIDFMIEWSPQKGFVSTYFKFKPKMSYALFTSPTRTRQDCLVLSVSALRTELGTLSATENLETVLSSLEMRWGLLKTVLTCRQFCSHRRQRQDKTINVFYIADVVLCAI